MNLTITVNHKQLLDILLNVGLERPVFIWGAPGIGKSAIVQEFADSLGLEWAAQADVHPYVYDYITSRPDHL